MTQADPRVWTVTEAKARLSEILRLSEEEGPQRIGMRKSFAVVPESVWQGHDSSPKADALPRKPLGQWLIENMPCGTNPEPQGERQADSVHRLLRRRMTGYPPDSNAFNSWETS